MNKKKTKIQGGLRTHNIFKQSFPGEPLVSVITVVYNDPESLENTIQNIYAQAYTNVEYIIIDGGSAESTINILKKYEGRIDYWISEEDNGIYDAMNKGLELATGDYINFMNAGDTFYSSDVLQTIFYGVDSENQNIIFGKAIFHYGNQEFIRYENFNFTDPSWYNYQHPSHQALFVPKYLYKTIKFDTRLNIAADIDYMHKIFPAGYSYRDIIVAHFDLGGISTYYGSINILKKMFDDIKLLYPNSSMQRTQHYLLHTIKYLMQKILGKEFYLKLYMAYLVKHYQNKSDKRLGKS